MDATSIIADWKRRLVAMAEDPPYVFRDTPRELIEQHQRRLTSFVGYSEAEVAALEDQLGVRLPALFRAYLLEMGKSRGDLFRGSDVAGIRDFERFRAEALALMAETDPGLTLPRDAIVLLFNQGYMFVYLRAAGGFDCPVLHYMEAEREPRELAATLADMVDAELRQAESHQAMARAQGGYYLTLHPDGGATECHPALSSGDRPLDSARGRV
jgi:hypothetical protein